jgi:outer membrane protein OmpA-like peptidoglycan-associated protein
MIKNIKNLCEKKHYSLLIILFFGLIIATLFELIGLGSLPLFAMLILDVQVLADNLPNFINKEKLLLFTQNELAVFGIIILTSIFTIKNIYLGAIVYLHNDSISLKLNAFLIYLAKENANKSIDVVGHWDNSETSAVNFSKALNHSNIIVSLLEAEGLANRNLNATSKGETEPLADNNTVEGRAKNRRVEIVLN